jgi:hypothetical protein
MYPASAAALFAALISLLRRQMPGASQPGLRLLALGAAVRLLTDAAFSYQVVRGTYLDGGYTDLGYTLSLVFFTLAAVRTITTAANWPPGKATPQNVGEAAPIRGNVWLPHFGLLVAFLLIVWMHDLRIDRTGGTSFSLSFEPCDP